jgi:dihydrodiol dehydrogenase / D-xylose 1-dehydrogenase (NADP)
MNDKLRWGVIGCGLIAPKFIQALKDTGEGRVVAVASKSGRRAGRLQRKAGVACAYEGYARMLESEQLDAVYIANTHAEHAAAAKLCLQRGLPVLVEKAFTRNAAEAEELIALAQQKKLFMMEAMWTRFNPSSSKVRELLASGAIGEVQKFRAEFCVRMNLFSKKMLPWNRMYSPRLAGGALLDIGVYPISFASMIFGSAPEKSSGTAEMTWTGVDRTSTYTLEYPGGKRAELAASFRQDRPREAVITGTNGTLSVPHFSGTDRVILTRSGREPETIECEAHGFIHQIRELHRCLRAGLTESPLLPLRETLEIMKTMDTLRAQWGMKYPGENPR